MQSLEAIKQRLQAHQNRLDGNKHSVRMSMAELKRGGHQIISHPGALVAIFAAGWWVVHYSNRPKQIKQAKNVTIKKPGLVRQLIQSITPFVLAELRSKPDAVQQVGTEGESPEQPAVLTNEE